MKRFIKAFLWIICYISASWVGIRTKLGFDILDPDDWRLLFDKSLRARWPSYMADKKLVCKVLLAFIIIGVLGLAIVTKKKKKRIPIVKGELPETENSRPMAMNSQGRVAASLPRAPTGGTSQTAENSGAPQETSSAPVNPFVQAVRQATNIANSFDVSVFPHVKLENTFTQLVVSDDSTALLIKFLPEANPWHVEQTSAPQESVWTSDGREPLRFLKDIMESTATLARLEPDAKAVSVVLMNTGSIENAKEIKNYLNQNNIQIATLDNQQTPDIPTWHDLLSEFYPLKGEENETNDSSQSM